MICSDYASSASTRRRSKMQAIGASPYKPRRIVGMLARLIIRDQQFSKTGMLHSDGKIELFYKSVVIVLLMAMGLLAATGGVSRGVPEPTPVEEVKGRAVPHLDHPRGASPALSSAVSRARNPAPAASGVSVTQIGTQTPLGFASRAGQKAEKLWISSDWRVQRNTRKTIVSGLGDRGSGVQISPLRPLSTRRRNLRPTTAGRHGRAGLPRHR